MILDAHALRRDETPLYSGRVLLLPFLEQPALYQRFDKNKAWDSPENLALSQQAIPIFQDPANRGRPGTRSDYVFVTGSGTIFETGKKSQIRNVRDGLSNTISMPSPRPTMLTTRPKPCLCASIVEAGCGA